MPWEVNRLELVLGTRTRSGQQCDIWEAVFCPVGRDGYPERILDKGSGEINQPVASYWREHYDLVHILRRDWETRGWAGSSRASSTSTSATWTTTT